MRHAIRIICLLAALLAFVSTAVAASGPIRVAVVTDGPSVLIDGYLEGTRNELVSLLGNGSRVVFVERPEFNAGWEPERVGDALKAAIEAPDADVVLCAGLLSTIEALSTDIRLTRPVISGFYLDGTVLGLPHTDGTRSGVKNLNYVLIQDHFENGLKAFKPLLDTDRVYLLVEEKLLGALAKVRGRIAEVAARNGLELVLFPMGTSAEAVLSALPADARAVYLAPPMRMGTAEYAKLVQGLTERNILSFSMRGLADVEKGVLAGNLPDVSERLHRRMALNIQQIVEGVPAENLPVVLPVQHKLYINMETADAMGYAPPFNVLLEAELLGRDEDGEEGDILTLDMAMRMAAESNVDIGISRETVNETIEDRTKALSFMLPQVTGGVNYSQIDQDRSSSAQGRQAWERSTAGVQLSQVLFDSSVIARYRQARRFLSSTELEDLAVREDVMLTASLRFLNLLANQSLLRIERENLALTRNNLELARLRRRVGVSGPEEVYRWETTLAQVRANVIRREADVNTARVSLNQALGVDQKRRWIAMPVSADAARRYFLDGKLIDRVRNMSDFNLLRDFSVDVGESRYRIQAQEELVEAQLLELERTRQRFYLPSLHASARYDHELDSKRAGTTDALSPAYRAEEDTWSVGLSLTLPLFEGGGRFADKSKAEATLRKFRGQLEKLRQLTGEEVQTQLNEMYYSYPNIELTRLAADRARKNLDVVRDKYAQGSVSIIDLLDAQNQAISQEQNASIAVYAFMADLMRYQRSISWMQAGRSEREKREFARRFEEFMTERASREG